MFIYNYRFSIRERTAYSFGTSTFGWSTDAAPMPYFFCPLIKKNTLLPIIKLATFVLPLTTSKFYLPIYHGEHWDVRKNKFINEFEFDTTGFYNCNKVKKVTICLKLNLDGILKVEPVYCLPFTVNTTVKNNSSILSLPTPDHLDEVKPECNIVDTAPLHASVFSIPKLLNDQNKKLFDLAIFPVFDSSISASSGQLIKELIVLLVEQELPKNKATLQQAYLNNCWQAINHVAHQLRGSASYCYATRLMHAAAFLEQYYLQGHTQLLDPLFHQLLSTIDTSEHYFNVWLNQFIK